MRVGADFRVEMSGCGHQYHGGTERYAEKHSKI
ncbi:MAG: hypothetical protein ACLTDV_11190 [Eubacterium sp.]